MSMGVKSCILIVDDDPNAVQISRVILESEGYQVSIAHDGDEALRKARDMRYDLAILDVKIPGIDGYKVCRCLRDDPQTATMSVLMFSVKSKTRDRAEGFDSDADD